MNDPPRTPLIKKGDELIFQTREMKTEELEWKYITSKKAMFAIFPAVNFTNPVGTDWLECVVFFPLDVYQKKIKDKEFVPNMDGNVTVKVDASWFVVSNGVRGKKHRVGAVYPTAPEHMYQGRFFYSKKESFDTAAEQSPAWAKFLKVELSKCLIANQPNDDDSSFAE